MAERRKWPGGRRARALGGAGLALAALVAALAWHFLPALLLVSDLWRLERIDPRPRGVAVEERDVGLEVPADLYLPPGAAPPSGALLLVHGLLDEGKRDPRLSGLAASLAARGLAVLVPEFPRMKLLKVSREEAGEIARAFRALGGLPGIERRGLAAFSFGAGPALLALAEPGVGDELDLLVLFGAYHDLREVIAYQTASAAAPGAQVPPPDPRARWYFLAANTDLLADPRDRRTLAEIARLRSIGPESAVDDLVAKLGPEGGRFYGVLDNRDPGRVGELLDALGPELSALLADLSPARTDLPVLRGDVILLHAYSDTLIPYPQTLALGRHLRTRGRLRVELLGSFGHVDPGAPAPGLVQRAVGLGGDFLRLLSVGRTVLGLAG